MQVTLTFDNGPWPGVTDEVLDVLENRAVVATFFVVGSMLARDGGRALAERARAEGHWIGNHTWSHSVPLGVDPDPAYAEAEIERTQELIGDLAHPRRWFRPFGQGGHITPDLLSPASVDLLERGGYSCVLWNTVPRDWEDTSGWVDTALHEATLLDHAVVVIHDLPTGAMDHLGRFIDGVNERGGTFVQEFPADVIAIDRGHPGDLRGIVHP